MSKTPRNNRSVKKIAKQSKTSGGYIYLRKRTKKGGALTRKHRKTKKSSLSKKNKKIYSILKRSCKRKGRKCHQKLNNTKKVRFLTTLRGGDVEIAPPLYDPTDNSDLREVNTSVAKTAAQTASQSINDN